MLSASLITVALILGYTVAVALMMLSVFGIAGTRPRLAVDNYRVRIRYKLLQDLLWIVYAGLGAYLSVWVAADAHPSLTAALLAAILIGVLWKNPEEARQTGLLHMLLSSACILAGIAVGYALGMRHPG